jgi:hypothetical protein
VPALQQKGIGTKTCSRAGITGSFLLLLNLAEASSCDFVAIIPMFQQLASFRNVITPPSLRQFLTHTFCSCKRSFSAKQATRNHYSNTTIFSLSNFHSKLYSFHHHKMSAQKGITLYSHLRGPNGYKVAMLCEELGLPYKTVFLDFDKKEQKSEWFLKINPNGRIPAIIDHDNEDFIVWESAAILLYLQKRYDTQHKFGSADEKEHTQILQWIAYQISGVGPYQVSY